MATGPENMAENHHHDEEFTPRQYQIDLYKKAIAGNTIIYLPTGSGKTYVTVMVIKELSEAVRKSWHDGGKRTFFAVNTVPLVEQQRAYVARHTDLSCCGYNGDLNVESWGRDRWTEEFVKYQVLVMTAQILLDLLNHGILPLQRINLIIFDECHHGVGDHPMRLIMKRFEDYEEHEQPKVLGTSATLLNSNVKADEVHDIIRELEYTFHAKVITVDSMDPVKGYGKPVESHVIYQPPDETPTIMQLDRIITDAIDVIGHVQLENRRNAIDKSSRIFQPRSKNIKIQCIFEDVREHVKTQGLYVASKAIHYHIIQLEDIKRSMSRDMQSAQIVMTYLITQLMKMEKIVELEMQNKSEYERLWELTCDQMIKLFTVIHDYHKEETAKDNKFCCIVFVKRRFTAKIFYHVLQCLATVDRRFDFLVPDYVVGSAAGPFKSPHEGISINKWSSQALVKFRTGEVNCLIATNVLDEGVDIPACSLVVHYDVPQDFRAYVQSKGRGRHVNSRYVIFSSSADPTFSIKYDKFCRTEQSLKNQLVGKTDERLEPVPEELKEHIYKYEIEPYVVVDSAGVKSVVTEVSAISLINRYCLTLCKSQDTATYVLQESIDKDGDKGFLVTLKLPYASPLREIIRGDMMPSVVSAKRSAAVKACKRLHEIGELTDHLLPNVHRIYGKSLYF